MGSVAALADTTRSASALASLGSPAFVPSVYSIPFPFAITVVSAIPLGSVAPFAVSSAAAG